MFGTRNSGGTGPGKHYGYSVKLFPLQRNRVNQCRTGDNGGTMLIVMKNRNFHRLLKCFLNVKTFRSFNILEINTAKRRFKQLHRFYDFISVQSIEFQIKYIDIGKAFKENSLALHNRFACQRADVSESEHRGAVGNNGH